jgi:hypothetical protein
VRVEVEQDADVAAAGFVDEVVEIVEGAVDGVDGLRVRGIWLDGGEEDGVGAEGMDVVEALGDAVETAGRWVLVGGRVEVEGIHLVDDGVLPPDVGVHAGAEPAGAGEGLGWCAWRIEEGAGEAEGEESAGSRHGHRAR